MKPKYMMRPRYVNKYLKAQYINIRNFDDKENISYIPSP